MSCCDTCCKYEDDEDDECYVCMVDLDEDERSRFLSGNNDSCASYSQYDEYKIVRHQM